MTRRNNAWPAYVDLFAGLLIATLGGMLLLAAAYRAERAKAAVLSEVKNKAAVIAHRLSEETRRTALHSEVHACRDDPDDVCVDLAITFAFNGEEITAGQRPALHAFCSQVKSALDGRFSPKERQAIQVVIEGHSDDIQPDASSLDARDRYLVNWRKSFGRAAAVMYEFHLADVDARAYNIAAVGYADSRPLCTLRTADCRSLNRRTTIRLHVDSRALEPRG